MDWPSAFTVIGFLAFILLMRWLDHKYRDERDDDDET